MSPSPRGSTCRPQLEVIVEIPSSPHSPTEYLPHELQEEKRACPKCCTWGRALIALFLIATILAASVVLVLLIKDINATGPRDEVVRSSKRPTNLVSSNEQSQPLQSTWLDKTCEGNSVYVKLKNLQQKEYNGKVGILEEYDAEENRWIVALKTCRVGKDGSESNVSPGDAKKVAIKPWNLVPACGNSSCDGLSDRCRESYQNGKADMLQFQPEKIPTKVGQSVGNNIAFTPVPQATPVTSVEAKAKKAMVTLEQFMYGSPTECNGSSCDHGTFMTEQAIVLPAGACGVGLDHVMREVPEEDKDGTRKVVKYLPHKVDGLFEMIDLEGAWRKWSVNGCAIKTVCKDGPAKAKLFPGDIIKSIHGVDVLHRSFDEISNMLKAECHKDMKLVVLRINDPAIHAHVGKFDLNYMGSKNCGRRRRLVHEETHSALTAVLEEF